MDNYSRGNKWRGRGMNHNRGRNYGGMSRRPFRSGAGHFSSNYGYNRGGRDTFYHRGGFNKDDKYGKMNQQRNRDDMHSKKTFEICDLNEKDLGITEFVCDHEGFSGIIKARFSDFHVNEIDLEGNIAKLTTMDIPEDPKIDKEEEDDDDLVSRYRNEHLPVEIWDKLHALIQTGATSDVKVEVNVNEKTKEDRTKIYDSVKMVFGKKIVGSTLNKDGVKYISFMRFNKNVRIDTREKWPTIRGGDYVHFLVFKEYCDTLEASMLLAESLRIKASMIHYAGTKDRRAKTTQWFSVKRIEPSQIFNSCRHLNNLHVGNFCYKQTGLKLGQLKGNRFRIALRNVTANDETVKIALKNLKDKGFLNYYGLQRFGSSASVPTYEIGLQLIKGCWKEAIDLILKPRVTEKDQKLATARKIYASTGDANGALMALGRGRERTVEGKLLTGLAKYHENDYVNALESIPRNMRLLYIHAYQSLVWNKIVSRRIKEFGLKPLVGDLVIVDVDEDVLETCNTADIPGKSVEAADESEPTENTDELQTSNNKDDVTRVEVKFITESNIDKYTIHDIVLPLPGYDIQYPNNAVKDWYKELLEADGLTLEMKKQKVKTYTLSGAYRKCTSLAKNLSWYLLKYNDPYTDLIRSDYDELSGKEEPKNVEDGKYKALIIDFCLSSSCYATMALREILKCDTSRGTHAKMNKYYIDDNKDDSKTDITENKEDLKINIIENKEDIHAKMNKYCIDDNKEDLKTNITENKEDILAKMNKNYIDDNKDDSKTDITENEEDIMNIVSSIKKELEEYKMDDSQSEPEQNKRKIKEEDDTIDVKKIKMEND